MSGRIAKASRPALKSEGKGWRQCQASGFIREAHDFVRDVRQGDVAPEFADLTPGFGTYHPQDKISLGNLDDPRPIREAKPYDTEKSVQDLNISDQEIKLSIQEGRAPRRGY